MDFGTLAGVLIGVGLSAACGFRVFAPLLVMNLAAQAGYLNLASGFDWIASVPALVAFSVATVLEVGGYYIPLFDNLLDAVAAPIAVLAGVLVSASVITDMDPFMRWTLAIIAGGGAAGTIQTLTTGARAGSVLTTAGLGNPIVSTVELGGSLLLSLLSIVVPIIAVAFVIAAALLLIWMLSRRRARRWEAGV